jgi:putative acetyltransferase
MERAATPADFPFIYSLYMHPMVNPWLLYEPMDSATFWPIYNELVEKKSVYLFEMDGSLVGMFKLVPQKHRNSHIIYLGGIAIHPDYAGRGYGEIMLRRIIDLVKVQGYTRIELTVAVVNTKAIKLYARAGFENEGVLKNYTFLAAEKRYMDEQVMALLI